MRVPLTYIQVEDTLDRMADMIPRVRVLHAELRRTEIQARPDGYPRSSGWDKASPATEYDDDGTPMPPRSDPTAQAVVLRAAPNQAHDALQRLVQELHLARRHLESAECYGMKARPKEEVVLNDGSWCKHHERHGMAEPVTQKGRRGLCGWCESFERTEGQLPPRPLLLKRAHGKRISEEDIRKALKGEAA